jgi:cyclin-D1-binding protein 1
MQALDALENVCGSGKDALGASPTPQTAPPALDVLQKDYQSLLTLVYTTTTKASLVLRPSEPAYKASLSQLQDLAKYVSSITTCATLYDAHGATLAKAARQHTADLLEHVQALAQTLKQQDDPTSKEYLIRTGAVHNAIEQIRRELPTNNHAAVQRRLLADRDMLADCLEEVQDMMKDSGDEEGEEDEADDFDDFDEEELGELGFGKSKPMSTIECHRAKAVSFMPLASAIVQTQQYDQCSELLRWTCTLHKKILRDFQGQKFTELPPTGVDLLSEHSHRLLLAAEDLIASIYPPQDSSVMQQAIGSINEQFQAFKKTLFADVRASADLESDTVEENMSKVTISDSLASTKLPELPHGYETSYHVLETCILKVSEQLSAVE